MLRFFEALPALAAKASRQAFGFYAAFLRDWNHFFDLPDGRLPGGYEPAHTFACFSQLARAFLQIFTYIIGSSLSAARLRAAVWQSIFTHDMQRYRRALYAQHGRFRDADHRAFGNRQGTRRARHRAFSLRALSTANA